MTRSVAATYTERIFTELAGKPLDRHLNRFAEDVRGHGLVADLGCGPGHVAQSLHEHGARMLGIDLSPRMIDWARKRSPDIEFRVGDMRALDLPGGLLLVAGHLGEETVHRDELWGHGMSRDFRFLQPARMAASLGESGFHVLESR